jgi:predicted P-loop ATPase
MLRNGMRLIELGEGVAARRADRNELKRDVTKVDDHYRAPWGRQTEKRNRGFVYVLTANDYSFLRSDQDGLRRVWPINAASVIDIDWIEANRSQLLAEAVALYDAGEQWWWDKGKEPAELKVRQRSAVSEDFLDSAIESVAFDQENIERGYTTLAEIKKSVEALAGIVLSTQQAQYLIDALGKHGFSSEQKRLDGRKLRIWKHESWIEAGAGGGAVRQLFTDSAESAPPVPPLSRGGGTAKS